MSMAKLALTMPIVERKGERSEPEAVPYRVTHVGCK